MISHLCYLLLVSFINSQPGRNYCDFILAGRDINYFFPVILILNVEITFEIHSNVLS